MIRKQSAEEQIATMKHLINFGVNENTTKSSKPIVEFKKKAANGKTYGIIRESTKYYIMEAPQKDTEVLAEDFDYIGGFNNRKENEYSSYSKASNALDLKIMAINETVNKKDRVIVEAPRVKADWENSITESMRKEIDRFNTITKNVAKILKEDKGHGEVPSEHTLPEAPAKNPSDEKVNAPYTQSGVANGEKDFKKELHNHETAGGPFNKDGKSSLEKNMQSDKKPRVKTDAEYLTKEKTYEPKNNVASEHPSGGKVVRVNENNKIRLKLTEEQVLAWNDNKNYMDMSHGTHVGSSDPYVDELGADSNQTEADTDPIIKEGTGKSVVYDYPNTTRQPRPGTADVETEDGDPFIEIVNESEDEEEWDWLGSDNEPIAHHKGSKTNESRDYEIEVDDAAGFDDDLDEPIEDDWNKPDEDDIELDLDSEEVDNRRYNDDALKGLDLDNWNVIDDDYGDDLWENRRSRRLSEDKLNVWGKHPAYRKTPMTLPPNKEVAINGAREWDDESAQGEEPFGKQIGDGSPYDEIVDSIYESIKNSLYRNKKKV